MPSSELPYNVEHYNQIRQHIIDTAEAAGLPVPDGLKVQAVPADPPVEDKYAPTAWGKTSEDLVCPSGQVCLVRKVDIVDLLKEGILNQVDFLTSIVSEEHIPSATPGGKRTKTDLDAEAFKLLSDSPDKVDEFGTVIDKVIVYTVLKPKLHIPPRDSDGKIDEEKKVEGLVYTDSIDLTDKTFIFNHAFGNSDALKSVRKESGQSLGNVESVEVVQLPPE